MLTGADGQSISNENLKRVAFLLAGDIDFICLSIDM